MKLFRTFLFRIFLFGTTLALPFATAQSVRFGYVEWPEAVMKTQVVSAVVGALGYETRMQSLSVPLVLRGVSTGDVDVFLEAWFPSMNSMVEPYLRDGSVTMTARNLDGTLYRSAVPRYVYEAGVTSMADLTAHAEAFGHRYYGIEPGNDGNEIIIAAIDNDSYGLSGWRIVESSEPGMLSELERATRRDAWIVFSGWTPHWMNQVFNIAYLDDPEGIWGEEGYVGTLVNTAYLADNPNLARFFAQFAVTADTQGGWIDAYGRQGRDPEEVAGAWIAENMDAVMGWLEGVTTVGGEPAGPAVQAAFGR